MESCAEIGKEPEKSYDGRLDVSVPPDLHRKLISFSIQRNQPLAKTVEDALRKFVV